MLVSIGSYDICDGTLAGGVAVSSLRVKADRLYDFVIPVGDDNPNLFDRVNTTARYTFVVKRTFSSKVLAEQFILTLDNNLPASGIVTFTTTGPSPVTRTVPNGFVTDHALLDETGATVWHQYTITGGPPVA